MGFDNECILNIQSLAGEYFCPVCRLLVYPNEALQSQCTHLYCKPCLTYIVSTTQACPYDGYLVTEADAKPLVESNKALAETIGKINVHCLFDRSGCSWQGPLSECTSHCMGCAFGNSPVVCNMCGIQIVHRQVQEHTQNCPGIQTQAPHSGSVPDAAAIGAGGAVDQTQAATQAAVITSQVQTQTTATPGKEPNQQLSSNSQPQAVGQAAVPTTEQWYQQHQQSQHYYQQYPVCNQYQQHYQQYYQQQAAPQYQQQHLQAQPQGHVLAQLQSHPQMQPQAQVQPSAQSQLQLQPSHPSVAAQPQNHAQVNQQQQTQPLHHGQPLPQPHLQSHPVQSHPQHMQLPQYQQPHSQIQHKQAQIPHRVPPLQPHPQAQLQTQVQNQPPLQSHAQLDPSLPNQPQAQYTVANAVTGHHSYPQPQLHQQMSLSTPPQHTVYVHPHTGAQSQMQNQFPQETVSIRPPGQVANIPLTQQLSVRPHGHQPVVPVCQRPAMQSVQQPILHQYVLQPPFAGQHQQGPFMHQQLPLQSHLPPKVPPHYSSNIFIPILNNSRMLPKCMARSSIYVKILHNL